MTQTAVAAVVLCAGQGKRMKSQKAKVLHAILGRPLGSYPVARALEVGASPVAVVVGHLGESVQTAIAASFPGAALRFAPQLQQNGTADAVRSARSALEGFQGTVLILYGDTPLIQRESLESLLALHAKSGGKLSLVTFRKHQPKGYGRIVREGGKVARIVEEKDATDEQRKIDEVNAGLYAVDAEFLWRGLEHIRPNNAQKELYLTDLVALAAAEGPVEALNVDGDEMSGVNSRGELAACARALQTRINARHMEAGVTFADPATTYIEETVVLAQDVELGPNVSLRGTTKLATGVRVDQGSILTNAQVAEGAEIKPYSVMDDAVVGPRCVIGPFARLRPGTVLEEGVHVGNFTETKKAHIGKGSKANHLSYLGDAEIGAGVNVGAGTITCNYDGVNKHLTVIEDGAFIGSDSQLVAPVRIGKGALVGAGTTVTKDVPADALVVSRTPATVKEGWAAARRKRKG